MIAKRPSIPTRAKRDVLRGLLRRNGPMALPLLVIGCAAGSAPEEALPQRPNIVLIVADDLGYGALGSYGQTRIRTPRLDRMASEGIRLTQFYSGSTVCAPSRSVLMTGQHTGHTPIRDNRAVATIGNTPLPDSALTVAEVLNAAGYVTGGFGKWGLGGPDSEGMPDRQGFDEFFGYLDQVRAHHYYPEFLFHNGERVPLEGNKVVDDAPAPGAGHAVTRGTYSHDVIMDRALDFVAQHRDEPFFLYVPVTIPHASLEVPDEAMAPYLDESGNSIFPETPFPGNGYSAQPMPHAAFAAMVSLLDRDVGRILDRLEQFELEDNTLVIFTSDNGPHASGSYDPSFFDLNGPLRGIKGRLYEGGIRVPLIARWPDRIAAGEEADHISYYGDFMATFAELADAEIPDSLDSISFLPILLGSSTEVKQHEALYWEYYRGQTRQAVRRGPWKAVRRQPMFSGEIELYNFQLDPGEERNVAAEHPTVLAEMERIMEQEHTPSPLWEAVP